MRSPDQIRERLAITWRRQWAEWLGGGGEWPKDFSLDVPTERLAQKQWSEFAKWVQSWAAAPLGGTMTVASRNWPTMGAQQVPTHVSFASASELSAAVGPEEHSVFVMAQRRWTERANAWPDLTEPLRAHAAWLAKLPEADYERFIAVIDWLSANRDTGLHLRQLPISGIDSKWIERHAGPITRLIAHRFGRFGSLHEVAGLAADGPRRRVRLLDPDLRAIAGGLSDLTVRLDELAAIQWPIRLAIVVENQQTALCCQDLPGAVVLMGGGFSVTELGTIPWLERIPLLYWGDIDTAGFAILSALRRYHPHTISCLMDEATLLKFRDLWSDEATAVRSACDGLREEEELLRQKLLSQHWGGNVRLEQERIPWPHAWAALSATAASLI
jgi:hypothetical protein